MATSCPGLGKATARKRQQQGKFKFPCLCLLPAIKGNMNFRQPATLSFAGNRKAELIGNNQHCRQQKAICRQQNKSNLAGKTTSFPAKIRLFSGIILTFADNSTEILKTKDFQQFNLWIINYGDLESSLLGPFCYGVQCPYPFKGVVDKILEALAKF